MIRWRSQVDEAFRAEMAAGYTLNEPVIVLAGQSASLVAGIMGALKARRCYVPLDAAFPEPRSTASKTARKESP